MTQLVARLLAQTALEKQQMQKPKLKHSNTALRTASMSQSFET